MKAGDLVSLKMKKTFPIQKPCPALVIDTWPESEFQTVRVMWENGEIGNFSSRLFEVISASR